MNICEMNVETKRGCVVATRWLVLQERPYQSIRNHGSYMWQGARELFGEYGAAAAGLPSFYKAYLLAEGVTPPAEWNRTHLAGYEGRKGSFSLRGVDLGEVTADVDNRRYCCALWRVRGFDTPTPGERGFLDKSVLPFLVAFVAEHRGELFAEAMAGIESGMAAAILEMRQAADDLEREGLAALGSLAGRATL